MSDLIDPLLPYLDVYQILSLTSTCKIYNNILIERLRDLCDRFGTPIVETISEFRYWYLEYPYYLGLYAINTNDFRLAERWCVNDTFAYKLARKYCKTGDIRWLDLAEQTNNNVIADAFAKGSKIVKTLDLFKKWYSDSNTALNLSLFSGNVEVSNYLFDKEATINKIKDTRIPEKYKYYTKYDDYFFEFSDVESIIKLKLGIDIVIDSIGTVEWCVKHDKYIELASSSSMFLPMCLQFRKYNYLSLTEKRFINRITSYKEYIMTDKKLNILYLVANSNNPRLLYHFYPVANDLLINYIYIRVVDEEILKFAIKEYGTDWDIIKNGEASLMATLALQKYK